MLKNVLGKILGSANDRIVKSYDKTVSLINDLEPKYHSMSDDELRAQTDVLRTRLADGEKEKIFCQMHLHWYAKHQYVQLVCVILMSR